jgi:hypothetical protein
MHREAFVVAIPADHPLASVETVRLTDLRDDSFVLYPRDSGTVLYDQVIRICHGAGFFPSVVQETPSSRRCSISKLTWVSFMFVWIYKRPLNDTWLAYDDKRHQDLLEHAYVSITRTNGETYEKPQVRIGAASERGRE